MRQTLLMFAMLAGLSSPLYSQSATPVEVACVKGAGTYKAICGQVKKAVKQNPLFKPSKKGNRYAVVLYARTGEIANGDIVMSVAYGAALSDQLSQRFPYNIITLPLVFSPAESAAVAAGVIDGGLVAAAVIFEAFADQINSYGASTMQFDEATITEVEKQVKSEIDRIVREETR